MSKIFLHIGLHKTATKFYQHHVFPFLDKEKFNYNPTKITQYLSDYIKAETSDKEQILKHVIEEKENLKQADERTIIISREIMSGNLFSAYRDWNEQVKLLHDMFPEAEIVISFRYQPDWLVSCYRESVHEHHYQSIEDFLNINNGTLDVDYINWSKKMNYTDNVSVSLNTNEVIDWLESNYGTN